MADAACAGPAAYHPRRARDSPLYRLAEAHHETFKQVYDERFAGRYGSWRAVVERTLFAFLDCGVEERGFARVRCDACRREFRAALSCKTRVFCPSCHARRAVLWAEWLAGQVLAPVDLHQWVFTLPKRLRLFFLHDRRLLGALSRCAWGTVRDLYRAGLEDRHAVAGMVVSIQTYGDQAANWQPHLHALVTAGVVGGAGEFTPLPLPPAAVAEELFRRRVIRMLRQRDRLEDEAAEGLLAWRHSGFSVHSAIRVAPWDAEGVERLCRYLVHPPIAVGRLRYDGTRVTYRGRHLHPLTGQDSVALDPLEMLARLCQHIPAPGMHLTRMYGAYANRTRGARARRGAGAALAPPDGEPDAATPSQRQRRRQWARLIAKVFEVDPLRCSCGGTMRIVGFILDPAVIRKILQHRPPARGARPRAAGRVSRSVRRRCDRDLTHVPAWTGPPPTCPTERTRPRRPGCARDRDRRVGRTPSRGPAEHHPPRRGGTSRGTRAQRLCPRGAIESLTLRSRRDSGARRHPGDPRLSRTVLPSAARCPGAAGDRSRSVPGPRPDPRRPRLDQSASSRAACAGPRVSACPGVRPRRRPPTATLEAPGSLGEVDRTPVTGPTIAETAAWTSYALPRRRPPLRRQLERGVEGPRDLEGGAQPGDLRQGDLPRQRHERRHDQRSAADDARHLHPHARGDGEDEELGERAGRLASRPDSGGLLPRAGDAQPRGDARAGREARRRRLEGYPGQPLGPEGRGWWLDDEKVAYPAIELARKLGVKIVCVHKGLPAPGFSAEHCDPRDVMKAAKDFPDVTFVIYHAGLKGIREVLPAIESGFESSSAVPWLSDLCAWKKKHPEVRNVFMEVGATFGMTAITFPLLCGHLLGMMIDAFGEEGILWGTDSIWWGSPQWQIEALRRFVMPESLVKKFGWKPLTPEVKAKILGLNAVKLFGVDPKARLTPVPGDALDRLKKAYLEAGPEPSMTQYGWVATRP